MVLLVDEHTVFIATVAMESLVLFQVMTKRTSLLMLFNFAIF